ncbi:MAG: preprotein translocase subunit YajC [Elusimicrobia bacterium]|nr:preprotein translocase subunit YajC [Elusimicrobiota bacterium]
MQPAPSPFISLIPLLAIFGIFYFLLIRPQQKQAKEHEKMLQALKRGDRVITSGGLYGTITTIKGTDLELKIAENVRVMIARSAVTKVLSSDTASTEVVVG